jgi:hypothetical protein
MDHPTDVATRSLERELGIISGGIAMVASGASPRIVVGGLRFAAQLLEPARRMAATARVCVVPLWTASEDLLALRFERIGDA